MDVITMSFHCTAWIDPTRQDFSVSVLLPDNRVNLSRWRGDNRRSSGNVIKLEHKLICGYKQKWAELYYDGRHLEQNTSRILKALEKKIMSEIDRC